MFANVAKVNKLTRGKAKLIRVEGRSIAVFNADGAFYALEDACPFDGASLGWMGRWKRSRMPGGQGPIFSPEWRVSLAIGREKYQELQGTGRYGTRLCRVAAKVGA